MEKEENLEGPSAITSTLPPDNASKSEDLPEELSLPEGKLGEVDFLGVLKWLEPPPLPQATMREEILNGLPTTQVDKKFHTFSKEATNSKDIVD